MHRIKVRILKNLPNEREKKSKLYDFSRCSLSSSLSPNNLLASSYDSTLSDLPHNDQSTWYFPKVDRSTATKMLEGKPHGTFLIRESSEGSYAVSIVCKKIEHCKIHKTAQGYGFAEPYFIYPSLRDLGKQIPPKMAGFFFGA